MNMFRLIRRFALALIIFPAGALAQPLAFIHARVIDGTGAPVRENTTMIVDQGRILAVGTRVPKGVRQFDMRSFTIMPALITDHAHVGLVDGMTTAASNYTRPVILSALQQYARYGVLTVMALGLNKTPVFEQLRDEQHRGLNKGADLFGVVQGIGAPGGMPPSTMVGRMGKDQLFRPISPEEARRDIDTMASEKTDLVKMWLDDGQRTDPAASPLMLIAPDVALAVINQAHENHLRVAVHIHDLALALWALDHGADILAHGIRDQVVDLHTIAKLKATDAWYIPTLSLDESTYYLAENPQAIDSDLMRGAVSDALRKTVVDAAWREKIESQPRTAAAKAALEINKRNTLILFRAGVRIGFGTDSGATPLRLPGYAEHRELVLLVQAGLTPLQALTLATGRAAALIGLNDRGIIKAGQRADFLVINGRPDKSISDIDHIAQVWQRGQRVDSAAALTSPL